MNHTGLAEKDAAFINEQRNVVERPKPVLVQKRRESCERVTRIVSEVVDRELANGSMPA